MENYCISRDQIREMKHCIGFSNERVKGTKHRKYTVWRNYFAMGEPDENWENLVGQGLAKSRPFENGCGNNPTLYCVSKDGFKFLQEMLDIKIIGTE